MENTINPGYHVEAESNETWRDTTDKGERRKTKLGYPGQKEEHIDRYRKEKVDIIVETVFKRDETSVSSEMVNIEHCEIGVKSRTSLRRYKVVKSVIQGL